MIKTENIVKVDQVMWMIPINGSNAERHMKKLQKTKKERIVEVIVLYVGKKYFEVGNKNGSKYKFNFDFSEKNDPFSSEWLIYSNYIELLDVIEYEELYKIFSNMFNVLNYKNCSLSLDQLRQMKKILHITYG